MHYSKAPVASIEKSEQLISKAKDAGLHYARLFRKWNSHTNTMQVAFVVLRDKPDWLLVALAQLGFTSTDGKRFTALVKE